jgi:hypothetical protein
MWLTPSRPLDRQPMGCPTSTGFERLWGSPDLARFVSCSRRLGERMRSAGKIPPPDLHVGRMPHWKPVVIHAWIEQGGCHG